MTSYDVIERNLDVLGKCIPSLAYEFEKSSADYGSETARLKHVRAVAQDVVAQTQSLLHDIEAAITQRDMYAMYRNCAGDFRGARRPALMDSNWQYGNHYRRPHPEHHRNYYQPPRNQQRITQNGAITKPKRKRNRNRQRPQNTINNTSIVYMINGQPNSQANKAPPVKSTDNKENGLPGLLDTVLSPIKCMSRLKVEQMEWRVDRGLGSSAQVAPAASVKRELNSTLNAAVKIEPRE